MGSLQNLQLTTKKTTDLHEAEYNPRIMPEHEAGALIESIKRFGIIEPLVVNAHVCDDCGDHNGVVISGHKRLAAARQLGLEEVPCCEVDLHAAGERAANIALNKIHGRFDTVKLRHLLKSLDAAPREELTLTGFPMPDLENLLAPIEMTDQAAFSKVPQEDEPEETQMTFTLSRRQMARVQAALIDSSNELNAPTGPDERRTWGLRLAALAQAYASKN